MSRFFIHDVGTFQVIAFYKYSSPLSVTRIEFSQFSQIDSVVSSPGTTQNDRKRRHFRSNRASKRSGTTHNNQNTRKQSSDSEARENFPSTRIAVVETISKSAPQLTHKKALNYTDDRTKTFESTDRTIINGVEIVTISGTCPLQTSVGNKDHVLHNTDEGRVCSPNSRNPLPVTVSNQGDRKVSRIIYSFNKHESSTQSVGMDYAAISSLLNKKKR